MRRSSVFAIFVSVCVPMCAITISAQDKFPIAPPPSEKLVLQARGQGVQIYTCGMKDGGFAWTFEAPDAKLLDDAGNVIGGHSAGPKWRLLDGSEVTGKVIASQPQPGTIPWLKLSAVSTGNKGQLNFVDMVLRTNTQGGSAPGTGCDANHAGTETKVAYTATYSFFRPN